LADAFRLYDVDASDSEVTTNDFADEPAGVKKKILAKYAAELLGAFFVELVYYNRL